MIDPSDVTPGQVSAEAGRAVLRAITIALDLARIGGIEELCFAPINKQALRLGGNSHGDEIHLFAEKLGVTGPVGEINKLDALGLFGLGEIGEIRPAIEEARARAYRR
ncbi:MAG: 4-hydroxythreonine-4-phosphate dehydrogenase PdxA [Truepera sp.]|nr:4-hydroxythreonine-4-phosphate dehydrogenase PdxA [Truepera sp.]